MAILTSFIISFAFVLDIYVPSIASIHEAFVTNSFIVHLTMSLFLLMTGAAAALLGATEFVAAFVVMIAGLLSLALCWGAYAKHFKTASYVLDGV